MFKALFIAAILAAAAQPAVAQSIFDGFGEPQDPADTELNQWKRVISRQIYDHSPSFTPIGRGRATVSFCVDAAGRVVKGSLGKYSGNGQALIAASVVSSLKLPPAPPAVKAELRKGCYWFRQEFWFN
jgi:hypothetical protein